ncbi:hypothetical protein ACSFBX_15235 [Variovorax sp. RB2P76]|uniref:hypothetical protein n=1 Tax=Variovorax sp. RB2P76 TaxID=3443736 RepID=UPI003F4519FC
MTIIVDASTLINLANGGCLLSVLQLSGQVFLISPIVRDESKTVAQLIDSLLAAEQLGLIDDSLITAEEYAKSKSAWRLDDGETECIIAAKRLQISIATDDGAARERARLELGLAAVTGSIGLLKRAIEEKILNADCAYEAFLKMRAAGGFLPDMSRNDFD